MELFTKLGLREVASLVGTLGKSTDELFIQDTVEVDGKIYSYEKNGNQVTIKDQEGKSLSVRIDYSSQRTKNYQNRDVVLLHHEVEANYGLPNGGSINIFNDIALEPGYESFENVQRHDLMSGLRVRYLDPKGESVATTSIGLDRICLNGSKIVYDFSREGIKVGNRTITLDGSTLVSISGMEAPTLQEVKDFNLAEEQAKIDKFIKETELHPFTKEALEDSKRKLARKQRTATDIIDYYDQEMRKVREAIAVRTAVMEGIDQSVIAPEVIEAVDKSIRKKLQDKRGQSSTSFSRR